MLDLGSGGGGRRVDCRSSHYLVAPLSGLALEGKEFYTCRYVGGKKYGIDQGTSINEWSKAIKPIPGPTDTTKAN